MNFLRGSVGKESTCNARDTDSVPGLGRSNGGGTDNPLQYSCLENPMDRISWQVTVHGVTWSDTTSSQSFSDALYLNVDQGSNVYHLFLLAKQHSFLQGSSTRCLVSILNWKISDDMWVFKGEVGNNIIQVATTYTIWYLIIFVHMLILFYFVTV